MLTTQEILDNATKELEARLEVLDQQMAPLRREHQELHDALKRLKGQGTPSGSAKAVRSNGKAPSEDAVKEALSSLSKQAQHTAESTVSELAEKLNTPSAQVSKVLKAMVEEGTVVKTGEKRGTKYSLA